MLEKLIENLKVALVIFLVIGFGVQHDYPMPKNAIVYVDKRTKTYFGEPTALDEIYLGHKLIKTRYSNIIDKDYKPDDKSRNNGDFFSESTTLIRYLLEEIGILPSSTRWNSDGTWRY